MKTKILFLVIFLSAAMAVSLSQANWSANASSEAELVPVAYLPSIMNNYCTDYFDDFSDPASGWEITDHPYYISEYLSGEYRVLTSESGYYYLFDAPACARDNYMVEVDVKWQGSSGNGYGIMFDVTDDGNYFYYFLVNTYYQDFTLWVRTPSGHTEIVPYTYSAAVNSGVASNHLGVTRNGDLITLYINGTTMGTWSDSTISGENGAGVVTRPYSDVGASDARFDNFSMVAFSATTVQNSDNVIPSAYELDAPISHIEARSAPVDLDQ